MNLAGDGFGEDVDVFMKLGLAHGQRSALDSSHMSDLVQFDFV